MDTALRHRSSLSLLAPHAASVVWSGRHSFVHTASLKDTLTLTLIATPATQLLPHLLPSCKITFGERLGKYPQRPGFQTNGAAVISRHQDDHSTRGTGNNDSSFLSSNFCFLLITEIPHRGDFAERNQKSTILFVDCCLSFCFLMYKKRRSAHLVEAPTGSSSCCSLHSQTCAPSCSIELLPCSSSSSPLPPLPPAASHLFLPQTWALSLHYFLVYLLHIVLQISFQ